jgi:hypothetical protein
VNIFGLLIPLIIFFVIIFLLLPHSAKEKKYETKQDRFIITLAVVLVCLSPFMGPLLTPAEPTIGFSGIMLMLSFSHIVGSPMGWILIISLIASITARIMAKNPSHPSFKKFFTLSRGLAIMACLLFAAIIARVASTPVSELGE